MKISLTFEIEQEDVICPRCWHDRTSKNWDEHEKAPAGEFTCAKCGRKYTQANGENAMRNKNG